MAVRKEVRLAGAAHHGMIQAGLILQEAAAIYDDLNAHHVQSYGPEARGPTARSEVIISSADIDYPKATQIDLFVATTPEAVEKYGQGLRPDALVILDQGIRATPAVARVLALPLLATAEKDLGQPALLPIVALGALVELSDVVSKAAIEAAVRDHGAKGAEDMMIQALEAGFRLAREAVGRRSKTTPGTAGKE